MSKDYIKKLLDLKQEIDKSGDKTTMSKVSKLYDEYFLRSAQEKAEPKQITFDVSLAQDLFAVLNANASYQQYSHWISKNDTSYGDHLLFGRLYEESSGEVDSYAEKVVALSGEDAVNVLETCRKTSETLSKYAVAKDGMSPKNLVEICMNLEKLVLQTIESIFKTLEDSDNLSLGLNDLLSAMHNAHEGHIYLLEQRNKA